MRPSCPVYLAARELLADGVLDAGERGRERAQEPPEHRAALAAALCGLRFCEVPVPAAWRDTGGLRLPEPCWGPEG